MLPQENEIPIGVFLESLGLAHYTKAFVYLDGIQTVSTLRKRITSTDPVMALAELGLKPMERNQVLNALGCHSQPPNPSISNAVTGGVPMASEHPWYLGACGDKGTTTILNGQPDGIFCVRDSEAKSSERRLSGALSPFTLAYTHQGLIRKSKIMLDPSSGQMWFANRSSVRAQGLEQLVALVNSPELSTAFAAKTLQPLGTPVTSNMTQKGNENPSDAHSMRVVSKIEKEESNVVSSSKESSQKNSCWFTERSDVDCRSAVENKQQGDFLVRSSRVRGHFVLCVCEDGEARNYIISRSSDGHFIFAECSFESVEDIVAFLRVTPFEGESGMLVLLKNPAIQSKLFPCNGNDTNDSNDSYDPFLEKPCAPSPATDTLTNPGTSPASPPSPSPNSESTLIHTNVESNGIRRSPKNELLSQEPSSNDSPNKGSNSRIQSRPLPSVPSDALGDDFFDIIERAQRSQFRNQRSNHIPGQLRQNHSCTDEYPYEEADVRPPVIPPNQQDETLNTSLIPDIDNLPPPVAALSEALSDDSVEPQALIPLISDPQSPVIQTSNIDNMEDFPPPPECISWEQNDTETTKNEQPVPLHNSLEQNDAGPYEEPVPLHNSSEQNDAGPYEEPVPLHNSPEQNDAGPYEEPVPLHSQEPSVNTSSLDVSSSQSHRDSNEWVNDWELEADQIDLNIKLGEGEYGEVFGGLLRGRGQNAGMCAKIAVKLLKGNSNQNARSEILREARTMVELHHPSLVKIYGICTRGDPLMIVSELCELGSLREYLLKTKIEGRMLTSRSLKVAAIDVANGMAYLEVEGVIHRDLAARNVLVEGNERCKVSDFGLARWVGVEGVYTARPEAKCPIRWTAPEALGYGIFTSKSDVYSFGVLLRELVTHGRVPFAGLTNVEVMKQVVGSSLREPRPIECGQTLFAVIENCMEMEPSNRPTFHDLISTLINTSFDRPLPKNESQSDV